MLRLTPHRHLRGPDGATMALVSRSVHLPQLRLEEADAERKRKCEGWRDGATDRPRGIQTVRWGSDDRAGSRVGAGGSQLVAPPPWDHFLMLTTVSI
jgi:hypothetical protein